MSVDVGGSRVTSSACSASLLGEDPQKSFYLGALTVMWLFLFGVTLRGFASVDCYWCKWLHEIPSMWSSKFKITIRSVWSLRKQLIWPFQSTYFRLLFNNNERQHIKSSEKTVYLQSHRWGIGIWALLLASMAPLGTIYYMKGVLQRGSRIERTREKSIQQLGKRIHTKPHD